jgi:spore maturation protein CgeB
VELYRQRGVRAYRLPIATNPDFFRPVPPRPEYECEVLVLGAVHEDRIEPVRALVQHFDTHVRGENWEHYGIPNRGTLFGEEALSALNSAKMAIIFSRTITGHAGLKVGVFDFLSAGCLVLTDDIPELHEYFDVGKEIVAFRGLDDMLAKIRFYLDHPQEADSIRRAGRQKVLDRYTWNKIWPQVLDSALERNAP